MAKITYELQTSAKPETVYRAVSTPEGFAGWWCRTSTVDARVGGEAEFRFQHGQVVMKFRFDKMEPNRLVEMSYVGGQSSEPWAGTILRFTISSKDGGSDVLFEHDGWPDEGGAFGQVQQVWGHFTQSLKQYAETGAGTPYEDPA